MTKRGRFITIEGGEGVGKSSLLRALSGILSENGISVVTTREPGGTPGADRIRSLFAVHDPADPWLPETEALLVSAGRAQHVGRVIGPALQRGTWVLCDRFADSTRVYQGVLGGMDRGKLETLIRASTNDLSPDCTLILDCDVGVALGRLARPSLERADAVSRFDLEAKERHDQRRLAFLGLAKMFPDRCRIIDASQPADQVLNEAIRVLAERFPSELKMPPKQGLNAPPRGAQS